MPTKLTAKQEKYIELRLQGLNQSESYRGAYNAEKMAPETVAKRAIDLEKHGIIAGRIAARQSEVQQLVVDDVAATKSWAVGLLMSVALRCAQAAPVLDAKGEPIPGEWQFREQGVVAAVREIASIMGWHTKPVEVTVNQQFNDNRQVFAGVPEHVLRAALERLGGAQ